MKIPVKYNFGKQFSKIKKIILIMKLSTILIFLGILQVSASVYSQQTKITFTMTDKTVKEVLDQIEQVTDFRFFYNENFTDLNKQVSIEAKDEKVEEILDGIFALSEISYKIMENNLILIAPNTLIQQQKVTGKITDASTSEPLAGVNVRVEGTSIGTISDVDGNYTIDVPTTDVVLTFSFIGYITENVSLSGRTQLDVTLNAEIEVLEEVVVTGYSVEKKKDILGSVAVVNTEEMLQTNSVTISGQLQGRAAGIFVTSDGDPGGESSKVRIRGFGSFGQSDPLFIIDGVPANFTTFNNLNPNDVESIQVLKDAAAASVYGARAASGVVIVSTKKGKSGKAKITLDMYRGLNYVSPNNFPDLLNAEEYGEYWWRSYKGAGLTPAHAQYGDGATPRIPEYLKAGPYTGDQLEDLKTSDPALFAEVTDPALYDFKTYQIVKSSDTDWFDELFNPAPITNIQLGASGGSENGNYFLSLRYFDQDNPSNKWKDFNRYTLRSNSEFYLGKSITLGENVQVVYTSTTGSGSGSMNRYMNPLLPIYDIMGNPASGAVADMGNAQNPIGNRWRDRFDRSSSAQVFGNIFAEAKILNGLIAKTSFGFTYGNSSSWNMTQQTYEHAENTSISSFSQSTSLSTSWTWTNTLTYSKTFGQHVLKLLAGSEVIRDYSESLTGNRQDYDINDDENFIMLDTGLGTQGNTGSYSKQSLASLFGRLDYSFADKYLFNATVRRDGSSKFGKNNRYGIFPAVSAGWRISKEPFMSNMLWLDDLKLRASYGIIGNQTGLDPQNQYTRYTKSLYEGYAISGGNNLQAGFVISAIGNPDARWEKTITSNIGFDMTILKGKIDFGFEYYIKETKDLLVENQAPYTGSSASQPDVNIGDMTNKGIDANLTARGDIISDLSYEVTVTFSHYKNMVNRVLDSEDSFLSGASDADIGVITRTEAGYPISYIWSYEILGFFNTQEEVDSYNAEYTTWLTPDVGRWKIKDQNGDKIIDELDQVMVGSPHPDFQVGLNLSLKYRNFDLNSFIFWNQGGEIFSIYRRDMDMNRWTFNRSRRMLYDSWTPENTDALLPKLDINDADSKVNPTDYFMEDITYVRMKVLQLGYTVPSRLTDRINISRLRVYTQLQNLFTLLGGNKPFTGLDPDASLQGQDIAMGVVGSQNPTPRQFVFGINMEF